MPTLRLVDLSTTRSFKFNFRREQPWAEPGASGGINSPSRESLIF